jgi:hypothetical protein
MSPRNENQANSASISPPSASFVLVFPANFSASSGRLPEHDHQVCSVFVLGLSLRSLGHNVLRRVETALTAQQKEEAAPRAASLSGTDRNTGHDKPGAKEILNQDWG